MESLRLAILASSMTGNENDAIKHAIDIAIKCSNDDWELVDTSSANLLLVWINSEKDLTIFNSLSEKYPEERLIVFASNEFSIQTRWLLPFVKRNIAPNILSIANLLSRIHAYFLPAKKLINPPVFFDPFENLLGIVNCAVEDNSARICSCQGSPELYLLPREAACYLSGTLEQLIPMILAEQKLITTTQVNDEQIIETVSYVTFSSRLSSYLTLDDDLFQDMNVKKYKRYAINELIWFATLISSRGRLFTGSSVTETVLLQQLPEYLRLDYYGKEYKPVADYMCSNAESIENIIKNSPTTGFQSIGFFNACTALNLLQRGAAAHHFIQQNAEARKTLEHLFIPIGKKLKGRIKIVVAGSVGSGKTAAIATLSDFSPISTETRPSDSVNRKKSTTTVAMDYGEIRFNNNLKIFLYGTPGQKRFDFMSKLLCENAWGMLLLIDNSDANPLAELNEYLSLFNDFLDKIQIVVGITHYDLSGSPSLADYTELLNQRDLMIPVIVADARTTSGLVPLLRSLVNQEQLALLET